MCWPAVVLSGILLAAALAGCGGSAVTGDGTTTVKVTIGGGGSAAAPAAASSRATPRPMGAAIPATVTAIRFTISGAGIADIVQTVPVTGATMTVTLQVPSGPGRTILVEALDSDGVSRFRGDTVIDAAGVALSITIGMAVDPSNPALLTWNIVATTLSTSGYLGRVTQGDGIAIVGGTSGELLSSTDGQNWTSLTSGTITQNINALAFGDNTFLGTTATWNYSSSPAFCTNRFYKATSDDVSNWTAVGTIGAGFEITDLAFGGGTFVAVGGDNAFYSTDNGATWNPGTISGVTYLADVAYGNGRFVAIGDWSDNLAVSTDGVHWTTISMGIGPDDALQRIGFGNGLFLATTSAGNAYTSPDGTAWLQRTQFFDLFSIESSTYSVAPGGGGFMVVTSSGIFFTFDLGVTWTAEINPGGWVYDGAYMNGAFIATGATGPGNVFRSGDL
jgi:hypothetical protein